MLDKPEKAPETGATPSPAVAISAELLGAYKKILTYQFIATVGLVGGLGLGLLLSYAIAEAKPPILILVTLCGMLGALFSALARLYKIDQLSAALISEAVTKLDGWHLLMYSLVPPLVGAIAAVVFYVAFVSGLVAGDLFPEMACKREDKTCNELIRVLTDYGPIDAKSYGKTLIWAFIAGFSERLVPDTLQSLVAKTQNEGGK